MFDTDGKFLRQITIDVPFDPATKPAIGNMPDQNPPPGTAKTMVAGAPWTLCITPPPHQVLYASDAYPGRIYKMTLDGKVLGVLGQSGKQLKQFGWIHEMACPSENTLYRRRTAELARAEADAAPGAPVGANQAVTDALCNHSVGRRARRHKGDHR